MRIKFEAFEADELYYRNWLFFLFRGLSQFQSEVQNTITMLDFNCNALDWPSVREAAAESDRK